LSRREREALLFQFQTRKASTTCESSAAADRTSPESLIALVNQIVRANTVVDIRETIQELKVRPYRARALAESLHNRTPMQVDTPAARIIQVTSDMVRDIEGSSFYEHVSRICHRIALADFYCAYRAAHAKSHVFLQQLDLRPSQYPHKSQSRLRSKSGAMKVRFIKLVSPSRLGNGIGKKTPHAWIIGRRQEDRGSNSSFDLGLESYCLCRTKWPTVGKCDIQSPAPAVGNT